MGSSDLDTLKSCARKYMYANVRNWKPKQANEAMDMGSAFHLCAAYGYGALADSGGNWLTAALARSGGKMLDRFSDRELGLTDENRGALRDMLSYYWEHVGQFDTFDEIVSVEEEVYFELAGWTVRATMDLVVKEEGRLVIYDHKTTGDIQLDQGHLPLDLQTHLYYLAAWKKWGRPTEFVHNFVRRFDYGSKQRTGPPLWKRADGTQPYLLTESGKPATRSNDRNDYVRRVRTPLTESQLVAFERELVSRLNLLSYHYASGNWPRSDTKLGFGCSSCPYYSICCTEMDGREINPLLLEMSYDIPKEV